MATIIGAALGAAALAGAGAAQDADILRFAINTPNAGWTAYGPNQSARYIDDRTVQGGTAQRIEIRRAGANPWDDGVNARIVKPIAKGDRLVLAFWARAPKLKEAQTLPVAFAGITEAQAPYGQVIKGTAELGRDWKLVEVRGTAAADHAAGRTQAALQLSSVRATIDLGPVFVLDLGRQR